MKKIIAIFGSPRENGNSDTILSHVIKGMETDNINVEKLILRDFNILPCNACGNCMVNGICVIKDDMPALYQKLEEAEGIIVASPIYFMGVNAQLKAFIDRFQAFWARKYVLHLPIRKGGTFSKGFFIATAARVDGENIFHGAVKTIKAFFHVLDTRYSNEILCSGLEEKQAASKKTDILEHAIEAGKNFIKD